MNTNGIAGRLAKLATMWPSAPCEACDQRPAVVCVATHAEADALADDEAVCPVCGRVYWTQPIVVGVECDAL